MTLLSRNGATKLATTSLPTGWKMSEDCGDNFVYVAPPEKTNVKCNTEDFGFIELGLIEERNTEAPENCDGIEAKRAEYRQYDWFVSYDCELVTVDGVQAVKETTEQNENTAFSGESTYTVYTFRLSEGAVVTASYTNAKENGKPEYTDTFNEFVKTFRFIQ